MAALEALLPEELERHCQLQRSRLDTYQKQREEVVLCAEARGYVAPKLGQVAKAREDRDDPEDVEGFGQWKGRPASKEKEKNPLTKGKLKEKMVQSHQDKQTCRRFKAVLELRENRSSIEGLLGKATGATLSRNGNDVKGKSGTGG